MLQDSPSDDMRAMVPRRVGVHLLSGKTEGLVVPWGGATTITTTTTIKSNEVDIEM